MIRTNIPFRLDRLAWSRFHLLVVIGLGITWILDGLRGEVRFDWRDQGLACEIVLPLAEVVPPLT